MTREPDAIDKTFNTLQSALGHLAGELVHRGYTNLEKPLSEVAILLDAIHHDYASLIEDPC